MALLRRLISVITILCLTGLMCFNIIYYLTRTEQGLTLSWSIAKRLIPGNISLDQLHGSIHKTISFEHFHYAFAGTSVSMDKASIDANLWGLLFKQILVKRITAENVIIQIPPPSQQASHFGVSDVIHLLSMIHIQSATINHLSIQRQQTTLFFAHTITIQPAHNSDSVIDAIMTGGRIHLVIQQQLLSGQWQIDMPQLEQVFTPLSGSFSTSGSFQFHQGLPAIQASINARHVGTADYYVDHLSGNINNQISNPATLITQLQLQAIHLKQITVPMANINITSSWHPQFVTNQGNIIFNKNTRAQGQLIVTHEANAHTSIQATLTAHSTDLALLKSFIAQSPYLKSSRGELNAKVSVSGPLSQPIVKGQLSINNGSLTLSQYNTQINRIQLLAEYQASKLIQLSGSANVGRGNAKFKGSLDLTQNAIRLDSSLKGTGLQLAKTAEYNVIANPDLRIQYVNNSINISGNINIPTATISPTDFSTTVSLPSDVVIVNQPLPAQLPIVIGLSIQMTLGNDIKVSYQNLSTKISGSMRITQQPGTEARAIGELYTTSGTYKGYGHTLIIQSGKLMYTGNPLTNPGIDVRAIKRVRTIAYSEQSQFNSNSIQPMYTGTNMMTVGLWVHGTINKPVITMFSEPPGLSQGDILSYIVFGYPQSQASGASSLALLNMASSPNGSNVDNITNKMQNVLNLTELNVGSTEYYDSTSNSTQSATTVNVGRNLGHHLSLHYNVGVFTPVSIFSLRYQLSNHFAIQSETSSLENGGDLLYQMEAGS